VFVRQSQEVATQVAAAAPGSVLVFLAKAHSNTSAERPELVSLDFSMIPERPVNAGEFGARCDGTGDDTEAINRALQASRNVLLPTKGVCNVNPALRAGEGSGGLQPPDATLLDLNGATLKALPVSAGHYSVIGLLKRKHVWIRNGVIQGERQNHTGRGGEWGFGISIIGSSEVLVDSITVQDAWGDGVYTASHADGTHCQHIVLNNIHAYNNRRQGVSIIDGVGLRVFNSVFEKTNGTLPESGVDIEPFGANMVQDVILYGNRFSDNKGFGFVVSSMSMPKGQEAARGVKFINNVVSGSGMSGLWLLDVDGFDIENNSVKKSTGGKASKGIDLQRVSNGRVTGNQTEGNDSMGIRLTGASKNVVVAGNVSHGDATSMHVSCIFIGETATLESPVHWSLTNNTVSGCGAVPIRIENATDGLVRYNTVVQSDAEKPTPIIHLAHVSDVYVGQNTFTCAAKVSDQGLIYLDHGATARVGANDLLRCTTAKRVVAAPGSVVESSRPSDNSQANVDAPSIRK
jgi:parallel beta-helix repeat protein